MVGEDGNWMHTGVEEIPCEQVRERHFLGAGVLAKQLRSWRREWELREREWDGVGEARRARSVLGVHPIQVTATVLGTTPLTKTAHENSLTSKSKV
jgi:hypothetical protein